ncbi:Permease of the drug/metabolite transporter (DMT) superfamily [Pseudovibrio ascidiaceicola]|uniref:Permease of the drug/metabolite transporter (DMT) superfamily n=1 Tax=Pseudovibrio ascidiaceicola TaxID=285279 RepID=A0A1I4CX20_9HYPH|nr:EamA family transporter [Pseudovibrio ascidiaceicola]SFK84536.1 Permease of the drug/metabolite transporter (DMT) superfamily [Pseudovibrio ascidiaceicola]
MPQTSTKLMSEICLLIILSFLWGASFTLIEVAITTIPPATTVLFRLLIGATILIALVLICGIRFPNSAKRWGELLVQGILQNALPFTLISWGQLHTSSGLAGLLNTTPPLFVFLISYFIFQDKAADIRKFLGILIGFAGVGVIIGPAAFAGEQNSVLGQVAITGASLCYALAALNAKRFSYQPPLLTAACSMTLAACLMAPIAFMLDQQVKLSPSTESLLSIFALGAFSTAFAMVIYFRLVRTLGPLGVTTGSYLRAGFSVLLGTLFLNEALTTSLLTGLLLIFAGVAFATGQVRIPRQKKKPA